MIKQKNKSLPLVHQFKKIFLLILLCNISIIGWGCSDNSTSNDKDIKKEEPGETVRDKDVSIIVTTTNRSMDLYRTKISSSDKSSMSPVTVTLNPNTKYQTMDGFGAAVTGSTCFNLLKMSKEDRNKFLKETFDPIDGLGYSYIRISIGCSDFSLSEYTCCDIEGIENFALQSEEKDYVIPILKDILKINPSIKILGSPWTCPRWMKVNNLTELKPHNSWTSGQLNPKYYQDYAIYFAKWIQAFEKEGINITAITPQNEPLNRGNSASLYMGWEEQRDFIKKLGPTLKAAGLGDVKIYAFDHNYNYDNIATQQGYPSKIYQDAEASQYIAGAAYHDYGGNRNELNIVHNAYPEKELLFTETSIGTWNNGQDLSKALLRDMENVALGTVNNWCKGVIVWNLMLDTDRGPNREGGCKTCYGAVDINNTDYSTITRNSHYYIISHLAAVVKPGAVRIEAKDTLPEGIIYSAFENTDNTYAIVLLNKNERNEKITIDDGENHFIYEVPAKSVISYRWTK
ncbi:glucosylceramidase [Dysgonomonas sp. PFB1-18]|uniref:glycoside hydrolase family 30 protein n=1 Tax=unclassified Dysgonomonas TaxID=2630389 RepID=UPI0024743137|nr:MULTISPECIES: glycoside hydrolase family 30 protein [unclassified Dysgonomonas]MDH6310522.1 glucosylceramidase [Dysgonomonas sp. PF1-14]MDH6340372.1 glucosylceramidase [Dysgonomonas sp. PF1-16]MDH6382048.1 glucosylceramidase [Dysgonomonas sp. PFB1-18]MDH6399343.1 glucosylceramidase [Dysgonomonas sp. PF1-23]